MHQNSERFSFLSRTLSLSKGTGEEAESLPKFLVFIKKAFIKGWVLANITKRFVDPFWVYEMGIYITKKEMVPIMDMLDKELSLGHVWIAVDFSHTKLMVSLAMGIFIKYWKQFKDKNGDLVFLNPSIDIRNVLSETKVDSIIRVIDKEMNLPSLKKNP